MGPLRTSQANAHLDYVEGGGKKTRTREDEQAQRARARAGRTYGLALLEEAGRILATASWDGRAWELCRGEKAPPQDRASYLVHRAVSEFECGPPDVLRVLGREGWDMVAAWRRRQALGSHGLASDLSAATVRRESRSRYVQPRLKTRSPGYGWHPIELGLRASGGRQSVTLPLSAPAVFREGAQPAALHPIWNRKRLLGFLQHVERGQGGG